MGSGAGAGAGGDDDDDLTPPEAANDRGGAGDPVPTRAAVVLPYARPSGPAAGRNGAAPAGAQRAGDARLAEAVGLAASIGVTVVHTAIVPLRERRPSTLLGEGQVAAAKEAIAARGVTVTVVDAALSPVQQRNLERAWGCKVIDRTGLILEIFGERARTREGSLQVELAHLEYQRTRLVRSWTHLERQRGGFGFLGGPGESQIEVDRRLISERIVRLKRELEQVRRTRGLHRRARERVPHPVVALVGYTNAGKSTLFNALTGAGVFAQDQLFATLDPTMRGVRLPSGRTVILSDTVGFISELPTQLVEAFRATLEEVAAADVILHVRDIAHPDTAAQRADVLRVLHEMAEGPDAPLDPDWEGRVVEVLNKADLLGGTGAVPADAPSDAGAAVAVSALTGEGLDALRALLDARLTAGLETVEYAIPAGDGARLAWLYRNGEVIARRDAEQGGVTVTVRLSPAARAGRAAAGVTPGAGGAAAARFGARAAADVADLLRRAARAEILPRFRRLAPGAVRAKSGPLDLVTDADEGAERAIAAGLHALFPGCTVVGEEAAAADPALLGRLAGADLAFVVDPLDGTANFAAGVPLFGCMAAAVVRGEVAAGWIHDPLGDDTAVALRGEGAWTEAPDGRRSGLRVAAPAPVDRMVGVVSWGFMPPDLKARVTARLPRLAAVVGYRCAAHEYRLAAGGHAHLLVYHRLLPWDHAAGWLLHREAGGYAAQFDGRPYSPLRHTGGLICAPDEATWRAAREALLGDAASPVPTTP